MYFFQGNGSHFFLLLSRVKSFVEQLAAHAVILNYLASRKLTVTRCRWVLFDSHKVIWMLRRIWCFFVGLGLLLVIVVWLRWWSNCILISPMNVLLRSYTGIFYFLAPDGCSSDCYGPVLMAGVAEILLARSLFQSDEKRLMHTIPNIAGNAVKFTKEGNVSVQASILSSESVREWQTPEFYPTLTHGLFYLLVQVKDSGTGITQQDIPHLFTKFSEYGSASVQSNSGAGLGLAICKRFVNLMGGHIWIESEGLGKGTTVAFLVRLGHCNSTNDTTMRQLVSEMVPRVRTHQGSGELITHRQLSSEDYKATASFPHYQMRF